MVNFNRITSAISEGRVLSGLRWKIKNALLPVQELKLRAALNQKNRSAALIHTAGDFSSLPLANILYQSLQKALQMPSPLPKEIQSIDGMSGQRYRALINHIIASAPEASYLEIGSWAGSTATAAMYGNTARVLCIDNWSQFGGPRDTFFANIEKVKTPLHQFDFIEQDFRKVDFSSIGLFKIYLFDGPHEESDQYDGVMIALPALDEQFILIVDDWNWRKVRVGTLRALFDANCSIEASVEIRTTWNNLHASISGKESDWHNGYFVGVIRKMRNS